MDKITLLNRALSFIGERPITNPDSPETDSGKKVAAAYEQCRREVLRRYAWNFSEIWKEIEKTTDPAIGYANAYALPQDYLRLLWVGDPDTSRTDYRLLTQPAPDNRRTIAINNGDEATLPIGYGADITLLHLWDPLAIKVFALWLALDTAKGATGQDGLVELLSKLLSEELKDAVGVDGQEQMVRQAQFSFVGNERNRADFGTSSPFTSVDFG